MTIFPDGPVDTGSEAGAAESVSTPPNEKVFTALMSAVLVRYFSQSGLAVPPATEIAGFVARLWALIEEHGLPPPLARGEQGAPHEMGPVEAGPLVARALGELKDDGAWAVPARQLVKACFQPEFKKCRDSYREAEPDGTCRRQELSKAHGRVSGAHCVDCPHWLALEPDQHRKFLAKAWRPGRAEEFAAHREVFLPEDFRALRRFVRELARRGGSQA